MRWRTSITWGNVLNASIFVGGALGNIAGVVSYFQQQSATDGSNGNGQGEAPLPKAGDGGEGGGSSYETAFDPVLDSIANLNNYSEQYASLTKGIRQSMNSQLYNSGEP